MTKDELRALCSAVWGKEWQTPLANALGVASRTVRRWASGDFAIPTSAEEDIFQSARAEIVAMERRVIKARHALTAASRP